MDNIGIICNDEIDLVGHSLFKNFRMALKNYLKCELLDVKNYLDLNDKRFLIIVDEHFDPNVKIWKTIDFINTLNKNNIKTIVFNFERIHSANFPWNLDHQKVLEQIQNLVQFVSDVDDAKIMNKQVINKQYLSKDTILEVFNTEKIDKVLFIGQVNNYYPTRKKVIEEASKKLDMDIVITERKLTYSEFLNKLNSYAFILNPLGTGKFINLRFYEALKLGCIPIQEIKDDMIPWYPELEDCISFNTVNEISLDKINGLYIDIKEYYLEDYFNDIKLIQYFND